LLSDGHCANAHANTPTASCGRGRIFAERRTRAALATEAVLPEAAEAASLLSDGHLMWPPAEISSAEAAEAASLLSDGHALTCRIQTSQSQGGRGRIFAERRTPR